MTPRTPPVSKPPDPTLDFERRTYRRVTRRLIPYLFLCYLFAYVDRVNVSFAKLQMQHDLGFSDVAYGTAAGIFFIGYFFFEVPANMMLRKIGAKYWLGPIMIVWGLVSASTLLVKTDTQFYMVRFLLGVVESGFFPGVILYLTFWYTGRDRAKMVAGFMAAIPISGLVGSPISGWILDAMSSAGGLRGWQWLYIMEAIPSVVAGIFTMIFLASTPRDAKWLNDDERKLLLDRLEQDEGGKEALGGRHRLVDAFRSGKVWLLCLVYFGFVMSNYGITFWLPTLFKHTLTTDPLKIGLLTMIPWGAAAITMVLVGRHSDKTGERSWHIATVAVVGAIAFALSAIPGIPGVLGLILLTIAISGILTAASSFWTLPTAFLSGAAAGAGIAWINSVGNLGGFLSPFLVGELTSVFHNMTPALLMLGFCSIVAAAITVIFFRRRPPSAPPMK
ncbi:MAG: MFS transporter [Bryobacteraceae bacterium]